MKLVQFMLKDHKYRIGVLKDNQIIDLKSKFNFVPSLLVEFFASSSALAVAREIVEHPKIIYSLDEVVLLAPIMRPDKVICIGLNYQNFCDELQTACPNEPVAFSKFPSCITGPYSDIKLPKISNQVDWEVELAVIIGKEAKDVPAKEAFDYVLGYTVAQDISARDWQVRNGGQYLLSKSMDTFCPLGPYIVTKDEIPDPHNLNLRCWVNGVLKQDGNTRDLVHKIDKLIEHLSSVTTLYPGDLILTGTPSGVGFYRDPPEFLKPGDIVESEIEGIGKMLNHVI
ncbi:fumarylacetoacetate hydrolase domain-containing protein 2-like [Coccinella septempunctata]|uniref:fumarylacetoacetate hydrolase domain-containing protein 2-like n=1 Tax=Coccinella septempunctata TaxID=41139 RepID=UPI001D082D09|nr:fumarylacetoacetate hydrolase domain-containing protein 2-like [Coccinella septempunctata]